MDKYFMIARSCLNGEAEAFKVLEAYERKIGFFEKKKTHQKQQQL